MLTDPSRAGIVLICCTMLPFVTFIETRGLEHCCECHGTILDPTFFWTQTFLDPEFFGPQIFLPHNFWTQNFLELFISQNFVWLTICLVLKFFLVQKFFWTQNLFGPKIFWTQNFNWPIKKFPNKILGPTNFFD